ncbi:MAG: aminoglycoside N(3)-acetyltransferase [Halanaerobiales bacterium]
MSEAKIISNSKYPVTKKSIIRDLKEGGVRAGSTVIVHSSLSSLGWVCGGPISLIQALMNVITTEGNIIMPGHSGEYSDPIYWGNPPVPEDWWDIIKDEMPAYQPEITPVRGVGLVPETFRKFPDVLRSSHPCVSFTAWGKNAEDIVSDHTYDYSLGEDSPLEKIYQMNGYILLIGVDHFSNTSLHLAECKANYPKEIKNFGSPVLQEGKRIWINYHDIDFDTDDFNKVGKEYEKVGEYKKFRIGHTEALLIPQKELVDFAVLWFEKHRKLKNTK